MAMPVDLIQVHCFSNKLSISANYESHGLPPQAQRNHCCHSDDLFLDGEVSHANLNFVDPDVTCPR